jgi:glutamate dehydrogenase/leucine dehydrogenase
VAGLANDQLPDAQVADPFDERGVRWVPDPLVSASGVIYRTGVELHGLPPDEAMARVHGIGETTARLLARATDGGVSPAAAIDALVATHLAKARRLAAARAPTPSAPELMAGMHHHAPRPSAPEPIARTPTPRHSRHQLQS